MDEIPPDVASAPQHQGGRMAVFLAGLQGGMVGVLWMLAWMGVSSKWELRSFWTPENLFATTFYGGSAIRDGFVSSTFSGIALYLLLYSLLGAAFAMAVGQRQSRVRVLMAAVLFGVVWYFLSFHVLWKTAMPLAFLLHSEHPTFLGHLIYGTFLGRFQIYLQSPRRAAPPPPAVPPAIEDAPAPLLENPEPAAAPATPSPTQSSSPPDPA